MDALNAGDRTPNGAPIGPAQAGAPRVLDHELFISLSLRWGVILSSVVTLIGVVALLLTGQTGLGRTVTMDVSGLLTYQAVPPFATSITGVLQGLRTFSPYSLIDLGLIVLIATPVFRVAVSVVAFALERDRLYMLISTIVLVILLISFVVGRA